MHAQAGDMGRLVCMLLELSVGRSGFCRVQDGKWSACVTEMESGKTAGRRNEQKVYGSPRTHT